MNALREAGIDPFGKGYERTHRSGELRALYDEKTAEEIKEYARQELGMLTLKESCLQLIEEGLTTVDELVKVAYYD